MGKIDINKALELRMKKGLSYEEIGKYFNASRQAAYQALDRFSALLLKPGEVAAYRSRKGEILESVEARLLHELVDKGRVEKASLNNVAYTLGVVGNMTRLEKGQSTSNIAYKDLTSSLDELNQERKQLQEALNEY